MNLHQNVMKTYEDLIESRTKLRGRKKPEDQHVTLLRKLNNMSVSISQTLKSMDRIGKDICSERYSSRLEPDNSLRVGRNSVRFLVELKQTATEVFTDIKECNNKEFREEMNYGPLNQEIDNVKKSVGRSQDFTNCLNSIVKNLEAVSENMKNKEKCDSVDLKDAVPSTYKTEPSASDFSVFENSANQAATSSPICKHDI